MRKNHSNNNLTKWILLLAIIAGVFLIASTAKINAQENKSKESDGFLDPFTFEMMSWEGQIRSSALQDQVSTVREWIRIPYRPQLRSPYLPD